MERRRPGGALSAQRYAIMPLLVVRARRRSRSALRAPGPPWAGGGTRVATLEIVRGYLGFLVGQMRRCAFLALILILAGGCSVRKLAVNELGDALAKGGTTFSADDDPELIGDALPFTLKLMESLLAESPDHPGLLLSTTSGFTQYSYGWVHQQADRIEDEDLEAAGEMRARAQRLYLRARNYGLRGLRLDADTLRRDPKTAVMQFRKNDVPLLYWTAAAWGLAISLSKDNPELVADLPVVEALIGRVEQLDETFEGGAVHSFLIAYESGRPGAGPEALIKAKQHFD